MTHFTRNTTIPLGRYATAAGEREVILTDLVSFGGLWTVLDVYAGADFIVSDPCVVASWLYNRADSCDVAVAYLSRSAQLGYPAVDAGFDESDVTVGSDLRDRIRKARTV